MVGNMGGTVGILVVGNEILDGVVLNTNSKWIINRIKPLNFSVKETITVRDDVKEIAKALKRLVEDGCDVLFTTGGLGPTFDDMTLQGVGYAFDVPLALNQEALDIVKRQYQEFHNRGVIDTAEITNSRRKMAVLPNGAQPLDNREGGAPGVLLKRNGVMIFSLPGVPKELEWIFDNQVLPIIKQKVEGFFIERIMEMPIKDESLLAPIIDEVMEKEDEVYVKSMAKSYGEGGIRLWVSSRGRDKKEVERRVEKTVFLLKKMVKERLPEG
jgi:nicotinamide-nucleotide amidase